MLLKNIDTAFRQDGTRSIDHGIDILIRDGRIAEIGEGLSDGDTIDCSEKIALPGLINCHTHTPNLVTRGWSDDRTLYPWLAENRRVLETTETRHLGAAARLSAVLLLETGTTTLNDMWSTSVVDDLAATGIRALLGDTFYDDETDPAFVEQRAEDNRAFIADYRDHPTIHPTSPAHSVYECSGETLQTAHELATACDVPFHVHVSETRTENEDCIAEHDATPTAWLDRLGVLDHRGVLAHGVHLTDDDLATIDAGGAGIAHCAAANLKLGSGIADVPAMDDIPVGIGTDSAASNNCLNMVREGRTAALAHKRDDPGTITAQRILDMLTCEAAATLGMVDEIGSLEEGKRADVVLLDRNDPALRPAIGDAGLLSNLIYSFHGQVDTTIVDGGIVVEDGSATTGVETAIQTLEEFYASLEKTRTEPTSATNP